MQLTHYPHTPGHKDMEASMEAAIAFEKSGKHARDSAIVLNVYRDHRYAMAADEAWKVSPENLVDLLSFRSRTSELKRDGMLIKTKERGRTIHNKSASRYILAEYARPQFNYDNWGQASFV